MLLNNATQEKTKEGKVSRTVRDNQVPVSSFDGDNEGTPNTEDTVDEDNVDCEIAEKWYRLVSYMVYDTGLQWRLMVAQTSDALTARPFLVPRKCEKNETKQRWLISSGHSPSPVVYWKVSLKLLDVHYFE